MATLFESGFTVHNFHKADLDIIINVLKENLTRQEGLVGFGTSYSCYDSSLLTF